MPLQKCQECHQAHPWSHKIRQPGKNCVYHDPDAKVHKNLAKHRGLPFDCPGCLGLGTVSRRQDGREHGKYKLTCAQCELVVYWFEGKDGIPSEQGI